MSFRPPRSLRPGASDIVVDTLQQEIAQEKASTLGRLTREFERALGRLTDFETDRAAAPASGDEHERLLDDAAEALWWFVVQREACGLRNTEAVLREYKVPAAVRLRMGVVRKR